MRRALAAAGIVLVLAASASALDVPYLSGRVNDDAGLLDARTAQRLESQLKDYETRTGRQFAVLTIPSLEGEVLEQFSLKVARAWRLGTKGRDDGILLLVARDDRKIRIEVGYGLEGMLPDVLCGRIIRDDIVPRFRGGDFAGGVTAGVDAILTALSAPPSSRSAPSFGPWSAHRDTEFANALLALFLAGLMIQAAFQFVFDRQPFFTPFNFLSADFFLSALAAVSLGFGSGALLFFINLSIIPILRRLKSNTDWGRTLTRRVSRKKTTPLWLGTYRSKSGGGGSFGGFSGGGGGFGGGGASGGW